jgi:hypothetical protein
MGARCRCKARGVTDELSGALWTAAARPGASFEQDRPQLLGAVKGTRIATICGLNEPNDRGYCRLAREPGPAPIDTHDITLHTHRSHTFPAPTIARVR